MPAPAPHSSRAPRLDAFRVCFVCTGNICRSPMAEVVFRSIAHDHDVEDRVRVSSAGTGDWHIGQQADPRTLTALTRHGYDGSAHRARQFDPAWFDDLDLVVALDRTHERALRAVAPTTADRAKVRLLRSFVSADADPDVADPYYSDDAAFDAALATIETGCRALFRQLAPALRAAAVREAAATEPTDRQEDPQTDHRPSPPEAGPETQRTPPA